MQIGCACVQHLFVLNLASANSEEQADLMKVEKARGEFPSFDAFYDVIVLGGGLPGTERGTGALIRVGTIHQAKGLEFESCVVTGCADGSIPLSTSTTCLRDVEEERRLLFVAASRAKQQLCFTFSQHAAWDTERTKTRRLSQFLRPLLHTPGLLDLKNQHDVRVVVPPCLLPLPSSAAAPQSLHDIVNGFLHFFGRHNKLYAATHVILGFTPFDADVPPCPLLSAGKATTASSFLSPSASNELLFKQLFLAMFRAPEAEWQSLVDGACQATWAEQLMQAQRAARILRGTQPDAGMPATVWPQFLDALQLLTDRLLAADVQRLAVSRAVKTQTISTTVDLVIDHTLFTVCYCKDEGMPSQPVVHLLAQERVLNKTGRYAIRTLVIYNIYTGKMWRAHVPSPSRVNDLKAALPELMRRAALVKLLVS
jgi:hypothetical protein